MDVPRMQRYFTEMNSPVGKLTLVAENDVLLAVLWEHEYRHLFKNQQLNRDDQYPVFIQTQQQLNEYFAGTRQSFELKLKFYGTEFQQKVWQCLLEIPFAERCSYADIARKIGNEKAIRAVGAAVGKNPISIIVPCHRVVGSNGKLTGFAGGLENKKFLLDLEQS